SDQLSTSQDKFGPRTEVYNGIDIIVNARFARGGLVQGGMNTGQTTFNNCAIIDSPSLPSGATTNTTFCKTKLPMKGQTQYKFSPVYPLPWWKVQASAAFQSYAGIPINATRTYSSAEIAPSLGRQLSAGATGSSTIAIVEPNTLYEKRGNQLDLRFTKIV